MINKYSSRRETNRWPLALFLNTLVAGPLNACAIWTGKNQEGTSKGEYRTRKERLLGLGKELALP
jgi:hypothetical protein